MLRAWGVMHVESVDSAAGGGSLIVPAADDIDEAAVLDFVERGGTAICFLPGEMLARAAKLGREKVSG